MQRCSRLSTFKPGGTVALDNQGMFNPSQDDVRRFFCAAFAKAQANKAQDALETIANQWMAEHPEYLDDLQDAEAAVARVYDGSDGKSNPFLHLSMHLSITEQCSIDQPRGIRQAVELLTARRGDLHQAHHEVMQELGTMLWEAQRANQAPDGEAYIDRVQQRATRD
jgi:Domain of unknown function (DUF1841)